MKLKHEMEINMLFQEAAQGKDPLMETQRLSRMMSLCLSEITSKLSSVWIISAKIDKLYEEVIGKKYGK